MQFSYAAVAAFMATAVSAHYANGTASAVWTTDVVTAYTTYCPYATEVSIGGKTYTVTEATTLTITDCPCTVSKPVLVTPIVYCSSCSVTPVYPNTTVAITAPAGPATTGASSPAGITPGGPVAPVGTAPGSGPVGTGAVGTGSAAYPTATPTFATGAASRAVAGSAAGLAGLLGLVAYAL